MKKPELYKLEFCEDKVTPINNAVIVYRTDKNLGRQGVVYKNTIRYEYTPFSIPLYIIKECHKILTQS